MLRVQLGGTFDPVHAGHLALARHAARALDADVHLMPAFRPPHRTAPVAPAQDRLAMLRAALDALPPQQRARLHVDDREYGRDAPSYSVDSLRELRGEIGATAPLALLIGDDAVPGLPTWHRWRELFALAHIVVATRPGVRPQPESALALELSRRLTTHAEDLNAAPVGRIYRLTIPEHPASASEIRRRLAAGDDVGDWLSPEVRRYIDERGLYRTPASR